MRYRLTEKAEADLARIVFYSQQRWGSEQARSYLTALRRDLSLLATTPMIGRARDAIRKDLRSHPVKQHVAFYTMQTGGIVVLRLLHHRMEPSRHL